MTLVMVLELIIVGCTDEDACNYDATANTDDDGCIIMMDVDVNAHLIVTVMDLFRRL